MICPHCRSSATTRRKHSDRARVPAVQVPVVRTPIQGADRNTGQRAPVPDGPRAPRRAVAAARQAQRPRCRRAAAAARLRGDPRDDPCVGVSLRPPAGGQLRRKRRGKAGVSWYLDETYVKVAGRWGSLYRAIDGDGELLDSMLSEHRDKHAARRFLRRLLEVGGRNPLTRDDGPSPRLPQGDPVDPGSEDSPPAQPVSEQLHRAGPSCHQAALLPDAGLRAFRVSRAILRGG